MRRGLALGMALPGMARETQNRAPREVTPFLKRNRAPREPTPLKQKKKNGRIPAVFCYLPVLSSKSVS